MEHDNEQAERERFEAALRKRGYHYFDGSRCPHCKTTGWALWTEAGRADYVRYLQGWRGMNERQALAETFRLTGVQP